MLKEALEYLRGTATVQQFEIDGRPYTDKALTPVKDPLPDLLQVHTLTGLVDAIRAGVESIDPAKTLLHVLSHGDVRLVDRHSDLWGQRAVFVQAGLLAGTSFPFGQYLEQEPFVIGLQSLFLPSEDLNYVLGVASNLAAEAVYSAQDSGIAQTATVKKSVSGAIKDTVTVKARVTLKPYRTFREAAQPASEFLFRLKGRDGGAAAVCAVRGRWRQMAPGRGAVGQDVAGSPAPRHPDRGIGRD